MKSQRQEDSFGYRELEESRLFIIRSPESQNAKHRNPKSRRTISDTESWKSRDSSSSGVPESRNRKPQKLETSTATGGSDTRSWRSQESRLFITGVLKSRNAKCQNTFCVDFGYREMEPQNTSSQGMSECRNEKSTFWCWFRIPGVGVLKHFATGMSK
jgi:hypothetical protein